MDLKYCKVCNSEFICEYPEQITCSAECNKEYIILKRIKRQAIREYKDKQEKKKKTNSFNTDEYLSLLNGCYNNINNKVCEICGEMFYTAISNSKYCSKKCLNLAMKKRYNKSRISTDFLVFERDRFSCVYCGKSVIVDNIILHIDHIYPVSKGGTSDIFNLATSCSKCNLEKKDNVMSDKNILDYWIEIDNRNMKAGKEHFNKLKEKFDKTMKYRVKNY